MRGQGSEEGEGDLIWERGGGGGGGGLGGGGGGGGVCDARARACMWKVSCWKNMEDVLIWSEGLE